MAFRTLAKIKIGKITIEKQTLTNTFLIRVGKGCISIDEAKLETYLINGMSDNLKDLLQLNKEA